MNPLAFEEVFIVGLYAQEGTWFIELFMPNHRVNNSHHILRPARDIADYLEDWFISLLRNYYYASPSVLRSHQVYEARRADDLISYNGLQAVENRCVCDQCIDF